MDQGEDTVNLMKNAIVVLAGLGLLATACSPAGSTRTGPSAGGAMQPVTELAVGTLKLDGTADAITKEQAGRTPPIVGGLQGGRVERYGGSAGNRGLDRADPGRR